MKPARNLFFFIVCWLMTFHQGDAFAVPVNVSGVIGSCTGTQLPVGARIRFVSSGGGPVFSVLTTQGGVYALTLPSGIYSQVTVSKTGFDTTFTNNLNIPANPSFTFNACIYETACPVPSVTSVYDSLSSSVHSSWQAAAGPYELNYDDGIQDGFTVWASLGSKNALRFSPLAYPVSITGGKVHIGLASNYPAQYNHAPFKMAVYDASGPAGQPGNQLAVVSVTPSGYEWIDFSFASAVSISSGDLYLVMIQETNYPNATGLAVDMTNPQLRSWAKSGSQAWVPAQGNFMIRALVSGPGGPGFLDNSSPLTVQNYQLYRLRQGEEQNPSVWTPVTLTSNLTYTDNAWPSLPCGPYRWAVKAYYAGNRSSLPCFSNVIGKCWTAPVVFNIGMSCDTHPVKGTRVKLTNQVYPDTVYSSVLDTNHTVVFPKVWKGSYTARVSHFAFTAFSSNLSIYLPDTLDVNLQQVKSPPTALQVESKTLKAKWNLPAYSDTLFSENWSSGSFSTQSWTVTPIYTNWKISFSQGNPAPSAFFDWNPQQINYDQSLQSPIISGTGSGLTIVGYDVYLDNYGLTTQNRLAVEIWNGTAWNTVKVYTNQDGSIPWTSEHLDITSVVSGDFRIRFRANGENSFDINGWNIDNIYALASESPQQMAQCIAGYYFLLGNVVSGFTQNLEYTIPGSQVQYGQTYNACVEAIYGSGISAADCAAFQSSFLFPVLNFRGDTIQNAAFLQWDKPEISKAPGSGTPPGLLGYSIYRDSVLIAFVAADTLFYYDLYLSQGTYSYQISARYDLAPYGFPGQSDESFWQGPVTLYISYGRLIPFFETWNQGSFSFNDWSFRPDQGNWQIDPVNGQPPPAAVFTWDPPLVNYSSALESTGLDPAIYHCAGIWMDFMVKLDDYTYDSTEFLAVEIFYNNTWHPKLQFANTGSFDWKFFHVDISEVRLKGFRIRFVAKGAMSNNVLHWMLDNINVYGICYAPEDLAADAAGYDVNLSWKRPSCTSGGMILDEGFEGPQFPPPSWTQIITDVSSSWKQGGKNTPEGVHSGDYAALLSWDYSHQDEWLIAHDVYVSGNLTFWSYAYQGSVHGDHYYVLLSPDQGQTWTTLLDLSALPVYPQNNGYNTWQQPYVIDMAAYKGNKVDIAWRAVDGDSLGLWYSWAIDDCVIGSTPVNLSGYDVYRKSPDSSAFVKLNATAIQDTVFTDSNLAPGQYRYYILALLGECTLGTPSDTVMVDVITGIKRNRDAGVRIFPNPAGEWVRIESRQPVSGALLFNGLGVMVRQFSQKEIDSGKLYLNDILTGVYILRIELPDGNRSLLLIRSD